MFCRKAEKTRATSFARPAHIASESCETGCKADVNQAGGDSVTACLPSRLSRVRAPSPAPLLQPSLSKSFTSRFKGTEQRRSVDTAVFFIAPTPPNAPLPHFL